MADLKEISADEVAKHVSPKDLWVIVQGKVYNVTEFDKHPGGKEIFQDYAGQDATEPFEDEGHSATAKKQMVDFLVGKLEGAPEEDDDETEEVIDTNSGARMRIKKKVIRKD